MSGSRPRPATAADVPRLTELVQAAYGRYVERIGRPPRPMTDDYAEVVRNCRVTVAELGGEIVGLIVLGVGDEGFLVDNWRRAAARWSSAGSPSPSGCSP